MTGVPYRFPEDRSAVRWGTALAGVAIFVIVGVFAFSYVYLWADAEAWPPAGHDAVRPGLPIAATIIALVALGASVLGTHRDGLAWHGLLAVGWVGGIVATVLLWMTAAGPEIRPTEHAYGSMSMLLVASALTTVAVATMTTLMVQLRSIMGAPPEWLTSGRIAVRVLWIVAAVVMIAVLAVAVGIPHLAPR